VRLFPIPDGVWQETQLTPTHHTLLPRWAADIHTIRAFSPRGVLDRHERERAQEPSHHQIRLCPGGSSSAGLPGQM
jgi:hypothetical protein